MKTCLETRSATARGTPRVLVVDDHPFFREGITAWIRRYGILDYCGWADSFDTAVAAIEQLSPDVILLDLELREGDGFDVLRWLQNSNRTTRVIIVSQKDETIFAGRALRSGAHGYVPKGEASDTLAAAIDTVLQGSIAVSARVREQMSDQEKKSVSRPEDRLSLLYNRELEVLQLLGRGKTTKEVAVEMGISPKTVESYRENLKKKLRLPDSLSLIRFATLWVGVPSN